MRKALSAGKRGNCVVTMLELLFVMTEAEVEFARRAKLSNDAEQLQMVSIPLQ
jgi:hypothetical protein